MRYHRFDPSACGFPRPKVPVLAPLTAEQLTSKASLPRRQPWHFARGRYALRAAYEFAGVGPRGGLLAPAYHCRTMLDPALRLGGEVMPYRLTADLQADLDGLRRAAKACSTPPRALLFTHFFGLPRDIAPVADWCRSQDIVLIEDCSHALVLAPAVRTPASSSPRIGDTGRYAVSSPYKFFPCPDGGTLWSNDAALPRGEMAAPGLVAELRGLREALQQLCVRRDPPRLEAIEPQLQALDENPRHTGRDWTDPGGATSAEYDPASETASSLRVSRWIQRHTDVSMMVQRRRSRYRQWADAVALLPGCRALFPALPADCTPYMFPLLVDDPPRSFFPLKHLGVPIWRWDDMAVSDCPVSQRYRQGVFHLPCHQALTDQDMAWMTAAVARVMRGT
ncbi:MAG: DegT/DnrJ/EryC1/StrS family aminotransferase [Burkholderiaceae bacterium]|nr:DegT/DnrJ/EryC1/StrS family aminotransferase [Burkholderiaceae bacterium]